ncbi:MAG: ABC transporter substrate-binding protein, partial [Chloroflexota bacterium]
MASPRKKTTRRAVVLMGGGATVALAACAQGSGTQGDAAPQAQLRKGATIVWAVDEGPTRTPLREDQVKLFKQQFPDLNVEFLPGSTGTQKLQTLFAAGTPPDMFRQETAGMAFFASRGQTAPLDSFMKRDKYDLADFFPAAWDLWRWKGKYYGVPFLGIRIAYYNRALSQQVGARKVPATWRDSSWTWDAFLEVCRKVTLRQGAS